MAKKSKKGERWKRINKKIQSELEYLAEFEEAVETSFQAADVIATKVARSIASEYPNLVAEVKETVERALLRVAPSDAASLARQAAVEVLGAEAVVPEIVLGLEANSLIGGTVEARAEMYVDATYATYENNVVAREMDAGVILGRRITEKDGDVCDDCADASTEEFVPLDTLPDIGDSVCGPRCRCEFELGTEGESFRVSEIFGGRIAGQEQYGGDVEIN